ncbi:MAG: hypothetical protein FWB80_00670 [Defluviitaleaceae bacterium]|nr:hypothetical protein [Defluviitaleaceae bacterium]
MNVKKTTSWGQLAVLYRLKLTTLVGLLSSFALFGCTFSISTVLVDYSIYTNSDSLPTVFQKGSTANLSCRY